DLGANFFYTQSLTGLAVFGPLAVGESVGVSGAELLRAVIVAFEVAGRVGLSFPPSWALRGNVMTGPALGTLWVTLGAAAASAKIRSLDEGRTAHALALVAASVPAQAPARALKGRETPMAKKYGLFGNIATSAIAGALLAENGFTGDLRI